MEEVLTTFLISLTIFFLVLSTKKHRSSTYLYLFAAGMALGITAAVRPLFQYFSIVAIASFFILFRNWKKSLKCSIIFILPFCMVISPAVYRTYTLFGEFSVSTMKIGWTLHNATLEYREKTWKELIENDEENPDAKIIMSSTDYREVEQAYDRYFEKAIRNIKSDPFHYLKTIIIRFFRIWISSYHESIPKIILLFIQITGIFFLIFSFLGIILSWSNWRKTIWLLLVILMVNSVCSLISTQARYTIPLRGFMTIFVSFSILWITQNFQLGCRIKSE
jgi:4-amino-4-deoxy-L-arabinose transferase-like glycosyltransferase